MQVKQLRIELASHGGRHDGSDPDVSEACLEWLTILLCTSMPDHVTLEVE
jgi:hypothetical protein